MLEEIKKSFQIDGSYMKFFVQCFISILWSIGAFVGFAAFVACLATDEWEAAMWCAVVGWPLLGLGVAVFALYQFIDTLQRRITDLKRINKILEVKLDAKNFERSAIGRQSRCEVWDARRN